MVQYTIGTTVGKRTDCKRAVGEGERGGKKRKMVGGRREKRRVKGEIGSSRLGTATRFSFLCAPVGVTLASVSRISERGK